MNAKGKKKRVRNSGEGGAVDERCAGRRAEKRRRTEKGETNEGRRKGEIENARESEGHGGSERRIKKVNGERGT